MRHKLSVERWVVLAVVVLSCINPLAAFPPISRNYSGQGYPAGTSLPPDTVGDVGMYHYVQMVNGWVGGVSKGFSRVAIYDKGLSYPIDEFYLYTLAPPNDLCANVSCGGQQCINADPIVLYDQFAHRWLLSEFALGVSVHRLCVYLSKTEIPSSDPNDWYFYSVESVFPDFAKFGVWPTDDDVPSGAGSYMVTTAGGAFALNRGAMLSGVGAGGVMTPKALAGAGAIPADADGPTPPPAGSKAIFLTQPSSAGNTLDMSLVGVHWNTADAPTVDHATIAVTSYNSDLASVPQPEPTVVLEPAIDGVMHRLQYRKFSDHEGLVGNFTIDINSAEHAGIRWFELRKTGSTWSTFQQGTFGTALDQRHRWVGSIAMDRFGDVALGYNVSAANTVIPLVYPGLRYTGRLSGASSGSMSSTETTIRDGGASSSGICSASGVSCSGTTPCASGTGFCIAKWGDYASMNVDPTDDCTFWFTGEYIAAGTSGHWSTRIASFPLDTRCVPCPTESSCGTPGQCAPTTDCGYTDTGLTTCVKADGSLFSCPKFHIYLKTCPCANQCTPVPCLCANSNSTLTCDVLE